MQTAYNFAQGPLSAVMPDRVPIKRRGTFAALSGIGLMVGALGGQIVGSMFLGSIAAGYVFLAVFSLVVADAVRDLQPGLLQQGAPPRAVQASRTSCARSGSTRSSTPTSSGRSPAALLLYAGYFTVTGYQFYILTDYLGIENPATVIPMLGLMSLAGIMISTVVSGPAVGQVRPPQAVHLRLVGRWSGSRC